MGMLAVWSVLALLAVLPLSQTANPGVRVKLTQKGLEYGRQIGMVTLQSKLKSIKVPDMSGKVKVDPIGKVEYTISGIRVISIGLPKSAVGLVANTGVSVSIQNAFISLEGRWKVKYLRFIKDSGSFSLSVSGLSINTTIAVKSDETGRPTVSSTNCWAHVGTVDIKFHGGASWLYNLFRKYIEKALHKTLENQICPQVDAAVNEMNPHLKTLNVLAKVDKFAEIEYSMTASPAVSTEFIEFGLKGEFYNIGKHQEPPFAAPPFSLPVQSSNMMYMGLSSYTANTAGFVYHNAGALSLDVTDSMIPKSSPIRLSTRSLGVFIPEIAKRFPNLMVKLRVKSAKPPTVKFAPNNMTFDVAGTVTAYAIQTNGTLAPLFILNLDTSVSAKAYITELKVAGSVAINNISISLAKSYVGSFEVESLDNILMLALKWAVVPMVNVRLQQGYPLPALSKMNLVNPQLQILKEYMLIGTDVHFST